MKKNRVFKSLFFFSAMCVVVGASVLHSCRKDVEPISLYSSDVLDFVEITVINSESKDILSGVSALVVYPDMTSETVDVTDGTLTVNLDNKMDGELTITFDKVGYTPIENKIDIYRGDLKEGYGWEYSFNVMLTKVNDSFAVTKGVEIDVPVAGSDASVKFPADCLAENATISVTETPNAAEVAVESDHLELLGGRIAIKSFYFFPEGQTFLNPIEVTFSLPNSTQNFEFATMENGVLETVPVTDNGDGTGTALVSHFCRYILTTLDEWSYEGTTMSTAVDFVGDCEEDLVAVLDIPPFDTDNTQAKDDLPIRIQMNFSSTRIVEALTGFQRTSSAQYAISTLRNVSKNYSIDIPSIPIIWSPSGEQTCHTGGAGN